MSYGAYREDVFSIYCPSYDGDSSCSSASASIAYVGLDSGNVFTEARLSEHTKMEGTWTICLEY